MSSKEILTPAEENNNEEIKKKVEGVLTEKEAGAGVEKLQDFLNKQHQRDPEFQEGLEKALQGGTESEEKRK